MRVKLIVLTTMLAVGAGALATVSSAAADRGTPPATHRFQPRGTTTLRAAGTATSADAATSACNEAARVWAAQSVAGAYESSTGAVQIWRETRLPHERPIYPALSASAADAPVAVCYLSGAFSGIPSAPGGSDSYQSIIIEVDGTTGNMTFDAASPARTWPFPPPPTA